MSDRSHPGHPSLFSGARLLKGQSLRRRSPAGSPSLGSVGRVDWCVRQRSWVARCGSDVRGRTGSDAVVSWPLLSGGVYFSFLCSLFGLLNMLVAAAPFSSYPFCSPFANHGSRSATCCGAPALLGCGAASWLLKEPCSDALPLERQSPFLGPQDDFEKDQGLLCKKTATHPI